MFTGHKCNFRKQFRAFQFHFLLVHFHSQLGLLQSDIALTGHHLPVVFG